MRWHDPHMVHMHSDTLRRHYHAQLPQEEKEAVQVDWSNDRIQVGAMTIMQRMHGLPATSQAASSLTGCQRPHRLPAGQRLLPAQRACNAPAGVVSCLLVRRQSVRDPGPCQMQANTTTILRTWHAHQPPAQCLLCTWLVVHDAGHCGHHRLWHGHQQA